MFPGHEIDYQELLDRTIGDFKPAQALWPAGSRLLCWIVFEAAILGLAVWVRGSSELQALFHDSNQIAAGALFIMAGTGSAFLALKSAIPGRETASWQITIVIALVIAALGFERFGRPGQLQDSVPVLVQLLCLAALPWCCLFWAVRRGVPLRPELTGAAVGLAAFCLAAALWGILSGSRATNSGSILAISCLSLVVLSAVAGQVWLNWIARWHRETATTPAESRWLAFTAKLALAVAIAATAGALMLIFKSSAARIPEFDVVIENYNQALEGFHPNVPSTSMETMLTAYVEHGMPAYMWDFGREGFRLVGGRWTPSSDGTPVTYTWFRGAQGGIMCMFRQTEVFNPPLISHDEFHHLLFYHYRGFSFCVINVGGYGNFVSVIAAPMPLRRFERLVLEATL